MIKAGVWIERVALVGGEEVEVTDQIGQHESMQVQWHVLRAGGDLYLSQVKARQAAHFDV